MTLWIILTAMTAVVAVWAAIPFLRRADGGESTKELAKSSAVYRDQLRQIDAELKTGSINEAEAQATRAETARRLVLAEREEKSQAEPAQFGDRSFSAVGIAVAVALGSTILYAKIGEPDRIPRVQPPGGAVSGEAGNAGALPPRHPAVARAQPSGATDAQGGGGQAPALPTVDGMIDRLVQRLRANPEDAEGWRMLGWSYASQGRFKEATAAYQDAIKRQPENADLYSARGEILVRAGNGVVSPEAANMFDEALKRDKADPRARFFLGLRKEQAGDGKAALDDWISILQGAPAGEPWARDLRERVEHLAAELKIDMAGRLPVVPSASPGPQFGGGGPGILGALKGEGRLGPQSPAAAGTGISGSKGLSADDDQSAMIRGMVDGLAARLEKQPRDFEGWSRLIRSRAVLGEKEKAKTALAKAREIFADTPEALAAIGATAREIRLEP